MITRWKKFTLAVFCVYFRFCNGYVNPGVTIFTTGSPTVKTKGQVYRIISGDTLELPCEVDQLGSFVILWRRKNAVLTAHNMLVVRDPRYNLVNGFNLQIMNVTSKDAGEYVCQIGDDKSRDVIHKVEVLVPPSIQSSLISGQLTARKGGNVTLQCRATGNPLPKIYWSRKNDGVFQEPRIKEGVSMVLGNVDRHHAGVYSCTADNGVGAPVTLDVRLDVLYPPEIEVDNTWYHTDDECTVHLTCLVHGNPTPNVVWYQDGVLLTSLKRYYMHSNGNLHSLKIHDIQASDFGNFSCESENSLGKNRKYIQLSGNPTRAKFLSSPYSHTMDSYNLTWVVHSFAPIDEVRLLFRKLLINESYQQPGTWQEIELKPPGREPFPKLMSYNIEDLGMSSVFQALLQVRNRFGWSEESDLFQFYTRGPSEEIYEHNIMDMELTAAKSPTPKASVFLYLDVLFLIVFLIKR